MCREIIVLYFTINIFSGNSDVQYAIISRHTTDLAGNFLYTLKNSPTKYTAPPSGKPRLNALPSVSPACVNHAGDSIKNIRK